MKNDRVARRSDRGRVLGVDYGSRRIGLALSDPLALVAQGAGVVANDSRMMTTLLSLISAQEVTLIVVGIPYRADGSKGTKAIEVERFINGLRTATSIPVRTIDESFTSVDAKRTFITGGMKRKRRQEKGRVDEMAARLLLQDFLDGQEHGS